VPGGLAPHLVLVEAGQFLAGLEGLLHLPAPSGHRHIVAQGRRFGALAAVIGQLTGLVVTAHQQMMLTSLLAADVDQLP
jgi:hypothetical protein